jgi:hypothetical protein
MINDVKRRAPYYWSDWTDAWDYRIVPATVYMYFAKYDPPLVSISQFKVFCSFWSDASWSELKSYTSGTKGWVSLSGSKV